MRRLALLGWLALAACSNGQSLGQPCATDAGTDTGAPGNCEANLICQHGDTCMGNCTGTCRMPCHADSECPEPCKCGETLSTANGGHLVCDGTGC
jgi:hypothetical protein